MKLSEEFWLRCWLCCLTAFTSYAKLDVVGYPEVYAVQARAAKLTCIIETDKIVKEVIWYKLSTSGSKRTVYYFEPPKFNASGPFHKNRVHLDKDSSSLVFNSASRDDEGQYECHVAVSTNTTLLKEEIPEERSITMKLSVNVPPGEAKLQSFTPGKNMTLTCTTDSKPPSAIMWIITSTTGETKSLKSNKIITTNEDNIAHTVGYLYTPLEHRHKGNTIACVVNHPETDTMLVENVTMVPPTLLYPVKTHFDWLGEEVPYSTYKSNKKDDSTHTPEGLVNMFVTPSQKVQINSTVVVTVSSEGSFPEPRYVAPDIVHHSYTWWMEDVEQKSGSVIRIDSLERSQTLFCLVDNPVGRVVMSIELFTVTAGNSSSDSSYISSEPTEGVAISVAMVAGIAFGALVLLLLIAFLIFYVFFKRPAEKALPLDEADGDDFESYIEKRPSDFSSKVPSGQTKVKKRDDRRDEVVVETERQSLLQSSQQTPPGVYLESSSSGKKRRTSHGGGSSTATTSGYGDDIGEVNGFDSRTGDEDSPEDRDRAITKHLNDFDENASFVGGYGSTFGLDSIPDVVEMEARESPFDQPSSSASTDDESYDSGESGVEGRYTLPPRESGSWEHIDPEQAVVPGGKPLVI